MSTYLNVYRMTRKLYHSVLRRKTMSEASRYMPRSRNRGARRDAKEYRCDGVDQCAAADAAAGFFGSAPSAPWTRRWPAAPPRV